MYIIYVQYVHVCLNISYIYIYIILDLYIHITNRSITWTTKAQRVERPRRHRRPYDHKTPRGRVSQKNMVDVAILNSDLNHSYVMLCLFSIDYPLVN